MHHARRMLRLLLAPVTCALVLMGGPGPAPAAPAPAGHVGGVVVRLGGALPVASVVRTLGLVGLNVSWVDDAARLLVIQNGTVSGVVRSLQLLGLGAISAVEANLPMTLGDPYEGKQSQAAVLSDDLLSASFRRQPAFDQVGLGPTPPETAARTTVAVVDGGFATRHEALVSARILARCDVLQNDGDVDDLGDGRDGNNDGFVDGGLGHGTATAALIAAGASSVDLVLVRVLDDEGVGSFASVASGIDAAVRAGARIINVSAGCPQSSTIIESRLKDAAARGILVIGAAGNSAKSTSDYPARSEYAVSIAGCDMNGRRDPATNSGTFVDLGAPSIEVVAPAPGTTDRYARWTGTSFAAPLVAAAVAQMLNAEGGMPRPALQRLQGVARPYADGSTDLGRGVLDLRPVRRW